MRASLPISGCHCHCKHVDEIAIEVTTMKLDLKLMKEPMMVPSSSALSSQTPAVGLPMAVAHTIHQNSNNMPLLDHWKSHAISEQTGTRPQQQRNEHDTTTSI